MPIEDLVHGSSYGELFYGIGKRARENLDDYIEPELRGVSSYYGIKTRDLTPVKDLPTKERLSGRDPKAELARQIVRLRGEAARAEEQLHNVDRYIQRQPPATTEDQRRSRKILVASAAERKAKARARLKELDEAVAALERRLEKL